MADLRAASADAAPAAVGQVVPVDLEEVLVDKVVPVEILVHPAVRVELHLLVDRVGLRMANKLDLAAVVAQAAVAQVDQAADAGPVVVVLAVAA